MPVGLRRTVLFGFSVIGSSVLRIGAAVADCPADLANCDDTVVFPDDYWGWILLFVVALIVVGVLAWRWFANRSRSPHT